MDQARVSAKTYLVIWGWLAGLMLLGVGLSALPISKVVIVGLIFGLSSIKAALVALYYMHLRFDRRIITLVAVFPLVVIALALLLIWSQTLVRL